MKQITAKISDATVDSVTLDYKNPTSDKISLVQKVESRICSPKNPTDDSLLILLSTDIGNEESSFSAHFELTYEFTLDGTPESYMEYGKNECLPMALAAYTKMVDDTLKALGFKAIQSDDSTE